MKIVIVMLDDYDRPVLGHIVAKNDGDVDRILARLAETATETDVALVTDVVTPDGLDDVVKNIKETWGIHAATDHT